MTDELVTRIAIFAIWLFGLIGYLAFNASERKERIRDEEYKANLRKLIED